MDENNFEFMWFCNNIRYNSVVISSFDRPDMQKHL